jgi:hypothetical protein
MTTRPPSWPDPAAAVLASVGKADVTGIPGESVELSLSFVDDGGDPVPLAALGDMKLRLAWPQSGGNPLAPAETQDWVTVSAEDLSAGRVRVKLDWAGPVPRVREAALIASVSASTGVYVSPLIVVRWE